MSETRPIAGPSLSVRPAERPSAAARCAPASPHCGPTGHTPVAMRPPRSLSARGIVKSYRKGPVEIPVLRGVISTSAGRIPGDRRPKRLGQEHAVAPAGHARRARRGEIHFDGQRIDNLARSPARRPAQPPFGMIFQFYHLLPELTTLENVLSPLMIAQGVFELSPPSQGTSRAGRSNCSNAGRAGPSAEAPAARAFRRRDAAGGHRPGAGRRPELLLADEPTGNLDQAHRPGNHADPANLERKQNLTIVMVTHDPAIAARPTAWSGWPRPGGRRIGRRQAIEVTSSGRHRISVPRSRELPVACFIASSSRSSDPC